MKFADKDLEVEYVRRVAAAKILNRSMVITNKAGDTCYAMIPDRDGNMVLPDSIRRVQLRVGAQEGVDFKKIIIPESLEYFESNIEWHSISESMDLFSTVFVYSHKPMVILNLKWANTNNANINMYLDDVRNMITSELSFDDCAKFIEDYAINFVSCFVSTVRFGSLVEEFDVSRLLSLMQSVLDFALKYFNISENKKIYSWRDYDYPIEFDNCFAEDKDIRLLLQVTLSLDSKMKFKPAVTKLIRNSAPFSDLLSNVIRFMHGATVILDDVDATDADKDKAITIYSKFEELFDGMFELYTEKFLYDYYIKLMDRSHREIDKSCLDKLEAPVEFSIT
jgi:hypothetical protein